METWQPRFMTPRLSLRRTHRPAATSRRRGGNRDRGRHGHSAHRGICVLRSGHQPTAIQHPMGDAGQLSLCANRLPPARRTPGLDGRCGGLCPDHRRLSNGGIGDVVTKWPPDVDDAQTPDGVFTDVSPAPGGNGGGTPAWGDAGVICPWTIYVMYGDKRILEQHLPAMTRWVDWCRTHSNDLIRDHDRGGDYGDWLSQGENRGKELIGTAFFAYSTSLVAKAYRVTGNDTAADKYQQLFERSQGGL